jgi:hypothetical protein
VKERLKALLTSAGPGGLVVRRLGKVEYRAARAAGVCLPAWLIAPATAS